MLGQNLPLKEVVHDAAWLTEPFLGVKGLGTYGDIHIDTLVTSWLCMDRYKRHGQSRRNHCTSFDDLGRTKLMNTLQSITLNS